MGYLYKNYGGNHLPLHYILDDKLRWQVDFSPLGKKRNEKLLSKAGKNWTICFPNENFFHFIKKYFNLDDLMGCNKMHYIFPE